MPESYYQEFYSRLSAQAYDFEAKNADGKVIRTETMVRPRPFSPESDIWK